MKIVYVSNSIFHYGGLEKITVVKANALAEIEGNEVFILTSESGTHETSPFGLSDKVNLISTDVNLYESDRKSMFHLAYASTIKTIKHALKLKRVIKKINPDVVISVGTSEKYTLPFIVNNSILVREIHSNKNYRQLHAKNRIERVISHVFNYIDFDLNLRRYDKTVILTKQDHIENWSSDASIAVIPNPSTFYTEATSSLINRKVIAVGRLQPIKGYDNLILAWKEVNKYYPNWTLEIWGHGDDKEKLAALINSLELQNHILLKGVTGKIAQKMLDASLFVLSSKAEGLPLVLIEAMMCGLPVVSYECPCGPRDIIDHTKDGFLVEPGNHHELSKKITFLIENDDVRKEMGKQAHSKALDYLPENIAQQWMLLFEGIKNEK